MNYPKETCCCCLSTSNSPFIDLQTKNDNYLSPYEKIIESLSLLGNLIESDKRYMICKICCETVEMIHTFNEKCLESFKILSTYYATQKNIDDQSEIDKNDINIEFQFLPIEAKTTPVLISSEIVKKEIEDLEINENFEFDIKSEIQDIEEKLYIKEEVDEFSEDEPSVNSFNEKNSISIQVDIGNSDEKNKWANEKKVTAMDKSFCCNLCNKLFRLKHHLKRHMLVHINIKEHTCHVCDKHFRYKCNLTSHLLVHSDEKSFVCQICEKAFRYKTALMQHYLLHTGERPYVCEFCEKGFTSSSELTKHKRKHTGHKPYKCEMCAKEFAQKSSLDQHQLTHRRMKTFECNFCYKKFRHKQNLTRHKSIHQRELADVIRK